MHERFRAFSFVDRITSIRPGVRIRGKYAIPSAVEAFPSSLVAEAVGQLAAWAAMSAVGFERRPFVAGLAGSIELLAPVRPGQELEMTVELESVDAEAAAAVDGSPVLRLHNCVGPMLPQEDYDDPRLLRDRFELLCGPGAAPGGFGGVPTLPLRYVGGETGQCARAQLQVPASAPFFADHFPRRPVFPGSLLMHENMQLAALLATEIPVPTDHPRWVLQTVSNLKLRAFIPPGATLELAAKVTEQSVDSAAVAVETRMGGRVGGGARVLLVPEKPS